MDESKRQFSTIDEYISSFPADIRDALHSLRQIIKEEAPTAQETVKYRMPTFTLNGNLVHFAAYRNHIGFYPTPHSIEVFKEELSPYKISKGAIQFPIGQPLPLQLIRKMVAFRVKEAQNIVIK